MIRKHIREQIDMRIAFMKPDCYFNGTCSLCGCTTTALQMANKSCDAPCYPEMMNKQDWEIFKEGHVIFDVNGRWTYNIIGNTLKVYLNGLTGNSIETLYPTNKDNEVCGIQ